MSTTPPAPEKIEKPAARSTRRRLPPWMIWVGVLALFGVAWFGWKRLHPSDSGIGQVVTGKVKRGDLIETVTATGSISAQTGAEVKIGSQITGRIKHLYADVGTVVKAGDLIAELDLPDIGAQLDESKASHAGAQSKLVQQQENVTLGLSQTQSNVALAKAGLDSSQQRLKSSQASAQLQTIQTPADIQRATASLHQANAALSTGRSVLVQVQAGANLQIQTAQEAVRQAQATDTFNQADLVRQQALLDKGYVAGKVASQASQAAIVSQSQVRSAQQSLNLIKQKVTADLQAAKDQVTQDIQAIESAKAALQAAQGETYTTAAKNADVEDARAAVGQAQANVQLALGNLTSNAVKVQDVQQARASVSQTAAQIAASQAQVDKTFIRTPISGTVLQLATQQGETLAAGLSAPTLIIVADLKRLEVDAYVDETDIGKVKIGQPVQITVDAFPTETISGKVAKVASGSTIQQGVVTYGVTIFINDSQHELKPDMTASVTIETGKRSQVLVVPSVAVQVGVNGSTVNVLTKKDGETALKSVPVKTGGSDGLNIEILSGLTEGQIIVLAGGQGGAKRAGAQSSSPFGQSGGGGRGGGR